MNSIIFQKPFGYIYYKLFLERKKPFEKRCLWANNKLNNYLKSYINKDMSVLEFGSGGSTLFFSDNCKNVDSVEEDNKWIKIVKNNLINKNVNFFNSKKLPLTKNKYDIVLVDGGDRFRYSKLALKYLKKDSIVILDNIERDEENKYFENIKNNFKSYKIFSGFTLGYAGYTSTVILYK